MTLFYNPKKRQVRVWVIISFIVLPVILMICVFLGTQGIVKKEKNKVIREEAIDIFDKF